MPQQIFGTFIPPAFLGAGSLEWVLPSWYPTRVLGMIFAGTPLTDWEIWVRFGVLLAFSIVVYVIGILLYERRKRR